MCLKTLIVKALFNQDDVIEDYFKDIFEEVAVEDVLKNVFTWMLKMFLRRDMYLRIFSMSRF